MRADLLKRFEELSVKLAEHVLDEADPATWPGAGQSLAEMSKEDRGNALWCKNNAAATFGLLMRCESVQQNAERNAHLNPKDNPEDDRTVESELRAAEKRAQELVQDALKKHGRRQPAA